MIKVNNEDIVCSTFPDGTSSFRYMPSVLNTFYINWQYDNDGECMVLWYLVHHIREYKPNASIILDMPYLPNARMDRVKSCDEVFTLKWFAEFINMMNFTCVYISDPHSNVGTALLNRVHVLDVRSRVRAALDYIDEEEENIVLCYPDEGATKKYASQFTDMKYVYGVKRRDWRTGKIEGLEIRGAELVKGHTVLIVDDICSRGGTFSRAAEALKAAGAEKVFLYVTHCENTILEGSVLKDGLISHVYTSDSIFRGEHEKITII